MRDSVVDWQQCDVKELVQDCVPSTIRHGVDESGLSTDGTDILKRRHVSDPTLQRHDYSLEHSPLTVISNSLLTDIQMYAVYV